MMKDYRYWHLSHFKLSEKLTKREMVSLSEFLVMKHFKKGQKIDLKERKGKEVYFLKIGVAKIISLNDNGEEFIKNLIKQGDVFGILDLIDGENENDCIVAIEDCLVCVIDAKTLKQMMDSNPRLNNYIFKMAGLRIQKLERKLHSLVYKDAETRVKEFITQYIEDFGIESERAMVAKNLLSNKDIGRLTSTSRQTVNKVLNELKFDGYIDYDKNIIQIKRDKLK